MDVIGLSGARLCATQQNVRRKDIKRVGIEVDIGVVQGAETEPDEPQA